MEDGGSQNRLLDRKSVFRDGRHVQNLLDGLFSGLCDASRCVTRCLELGVRRRFRRRAAYMRILRRVATSFHPMNNATVINKAPVSKYEEFIRQTNSAPPIKGPLAWPRLLAAF